MGVSAGAICAGKSASVAFWKGWDDPGVVEGEWTTARLRGGALCDAHIFPHFDKNLHEQLVADRRVELFQSNPVREEEGEVGAATKSGGGVVVDDDDDDANYNENKRNERPVPRVETISDSAAMVRATSRAADGRLVTRQFDIHQDGSLTRVKL
jgi:hypothetical protein